MDTEYTPTRSTNTAKAKEVLLRLPSELAERLRRLAKAHDRSLNGELVWALRAYVDREEARGAAAMAREQQQPMSDARLVTVRQRQREAAYDAKYDNDQWALVYYADVGELLDDNERLRAREAALMEIVERVASEDVTIYPMADGEDACACCGALVGHDETCVVDQARTFLEPSDMELLASDSQS